MENKEETYWVKVSLIKKAEAEEQKSIVQTMKVKSHRCKEALRGHFSNEDFLDEDEILTGLKIKKWPSNWS